MATSLENCISKHFSCSTTAHRRSLYRYSNCFMVLLNQRTYYESCSIRGTMSTLGSGSSRDSNPAQLSTIRFNDSRTFMETPLHGNSQAELSKHNHKKNRQNSLEMEVNIGSPNIVWVLCTNSCRCRTKNILLMTLWARTWSISTGTNILYKKWI